MPNEWYRQEKLGEGIGTSKRKEEKEKGGERKSSQVAKKIESERDVEKGEERRSKRVMEKIESKREVVKRKSDGGGKRQ